MKRGKAGEQAEDAACSPFSLLPFNAGGATRRRHPGRVPPTDLKYPRWAVLDGVPTKGAIRLDNAEYSITQSNLYHNVRPAMLGPALSLGFNMLHWAMAIVGVAALALGAMLAVPLNGMPMLESISRTARTLDHSDLPLVDRFQARDGTTLGYRHYLPHEPSVPRLAGWSMVLRVRAPRSMPSPRRSPAPASRPLRRTSAATVSLARAATSAMSASSRMTWPIFSARSARRGPACR